MRGTLILVCLLLGCGDSGGEVFSLRFINASGGNPTTGTDVSTLDVYIKQGTADVQTFSADVTDGDFALDIELLALEFPVQLAAEFGGGADRRLGSFPTFRPAAIGDGINIVVGTPNTCETIANVPLVSLRAGGGAMLYEQFVLLAGGNAGSGKQFEFVDLGSLASAEFPGAPQSMPGRATVAKLVDGTALVLAEDDSTVIFRMGSVSNRVEDILLHTGVGPTSAVVSLPDGGAAVVGGASTEIAKASVVLQASNADVFSVEELDLNVARMAPAAAYVGGGVLIVGGDTAGSVEFLDLTSGESTTLAATVPDRQQSVLVTAPDNESVLLIGGIDSTDALLTDTVMFSGCPACTAEAGPTWSMAREAFSIPADSQYIVGGDNSTLVEQIVFSSPAVIERVADLSKARASSAGIVFQSGVLAVFGGTDSGASRLGDIEYCFPDELLLPQD